MTTVSRKKRKYEQLFTFQRGRCWICGSHMIRRIKKKRLTGNTATFDHIRPTSLGGGFWADNLRLACKRCNGFRGNKFWDAMHHRIFDAVDITWNQFLDMTPALRKQALEEFIVPSNDAGTKSYTYAFDLPKIPT